MTRAIKTAMAVVSIAETMSETDDLSAIFFGPAEFMSISNRSVKTLAGRIAAKKAVVNLLTSLGIVGLEPHQIVIETTEGGAPRVVFAGDFDHDRLFISISHSSKTAVAVATVQTEEGN